MTEHGCKMFGFSAGESVTWKSVIDTVHPDDHQAARAAVRFAASSYQVVDSEFRIVRRDGVIRWIRVQARSERNEHGQKIKISGTFADITAEKAIDGELAQQRRDLAHLMRVSMLGELSGSIAHELMQPLTAILSNAQAAKLLLAGAKPDIAEVSAALDDIIAEGNRAGDVIHHMRGMLKKGEAKLESIDFNKLIVSTLHLLRGELLARGVKCQCDLAKTLPAISGDPVQLQQVLLNLTMNAVEAMNELSPSRRTVAIRTQAWEDGRVSIAISDNGTGLASAHEEKIFQPFFSTKERGLGLGLAICSSIIELHGGTLDLKNNPKGGATATLIIPGEKTFGVVTGGVES
jgi:PAS domain S-box-containing protein